MTRLAALIPFFLPVLFGQTASAADTSAALAPAYSAQPCCELCPAAADEANYRDGDLPSLWPLVTGRDGWVFRSKTDMTTEFGPEDKSLRMLSLFAKALKARGTTLMMIYLPSRGVMSQQYVQGPFDYEQAVEGYRAALARFRQQGVDAAPLDTLVGHTDGDFFLKRDMHWNQVGARATAKVVADYALQHYPFVRQLPKVEYTTQVAEYIPVDGIWHRAISQLCHQGYPAQYSYTTVTHPKDDLFGQDDTQPGIVLVGTSFSASVSQRANFEGYLKQSLSRDVLNVAMSGGEESGAWLEYLPTELFQKSPPKLVLWELPSHYTMKDKSLFRQLIPLVNNGCENKPLLLSKKVSLAPGAPSNELVFNQSLLSYPSRDLVMDMKLSDPDVHQMDVGIWYANGEQETLNVKQNKRANTGGRFVFNLSQDEYLGNQHFISLDLQKIISTKPSVELSLDVCEAGAPSRPAVATTHLTTTRSSS